MEHFKRVTTGTDQMNAVVMGRRTWESIPAKFRPLQGRINVVLTRQENAVLPDGVIVASSLQDAATKLGECCNGKVFVIGGAQIYEQAVAEGLVNSILYTEISEVPGAKFDTFFPELSADEWEVKAYGSSDEGDKENGPTEAEEQVDPKSGLRYRFLEYTRRTPAPKNLEEMQYLDLCREILETGIQRGDRTGTGTLSKFGTQMRFSLRDDTLPLLTTKRTFWRGVAEELLWFVQVRIIQQTLSDKVGEL
jgi:dihydrofolate reductase / thymidylate synthase